MSIVNGSTTQNIATLTFLEKYCIPKASSAVQRLMIILTMSFWVTWLLMDALNDIHRSIITSCVFRFEWRDCWWTLSPEWIDGYIIHPLFMVVQQVQPKNCYSSLSGEMLNFPSFVGDSSVDDYSDGGRFEWRDYLWHCEQSSPEVHYVIRIPFLETWLLMDSLDDVRRSSISISKCTLTMVVLIPEWGNGSI